MQFKIKHVQGTTYSIDGTPFQYTIVKTLNENQVLTRVIVQKLSTGKYFPKLFRAIEKGINERIQENKSDSLPTALHISDDQYSEVAALMKFANGDYFIYPIDQNEIINTQEIFTKIQDGTYVLYDKETKIGTFNINSRCKEYGAGRNLMIPNDDGIPIFNKNGQTEETVGKIYFKTKCDNNVILRNAKGEVAGIAQSFDDVPEFSYNVVLNVNNSINNSSYGGALIFRMRDKYMKR